MVYTSTGSGAFRSKSGSLSQKLATEFAAIDTAIDTNTTSISNILDVINSGQKIQKGNLAAGNANVISFAWQNPEWTKIIVNRIMLRLTTAGGTGGAVMNVGIVADATSTADNLIDGLDINQTGVFDNITNKGDNGLSIGLVDEPGGTNDYITGKILTQNAASLAGKFYVAYTIIV